MELGDVGGHWEGTVRNWDGTRGHQGKLGAGWGGTGQWGAKMELGGTGGNWDGQHTWQASKPSARLVSPLGARCKLG